MSSVDKRNIKIFHQNHHSWLYQLFNRKLSNHADAADLAHDAFLRLLKTPKNFDSNTGARAYLSHMARGMCSDLWRRKHIEQAWLDTLTNQPYAFILAPSSKLLLLRY